MSKDDPEMYEIDVIVNIENRLSVYKGISISKELYNDETALIDYLTQKMREKSGCDSVKLIGVDIKVVAL